jgi:hypothetical protein
MMLVITSAMVFVVLSATLSRAQEKTAAAPAPTTAASADTLPAPVIDDNAGNVRVFVDKIEVIGTIAKPQALFIIPGRDPKVDGIQIDRSFFRDIFRPMEMGRFPRLTRRSSSGNIPW